MAYKMTQPAVNLRWFHPDGRGVTDNDLVEVTLKDGGRMYFRYGPVAPGDEHVWYLDKELLPDALRDYLDGKGYWLLPNHSSPGVRIGRDVDLEHTLSQYGGRDCIEFSTMSPVVSMWATEREKCRRSSEIRGRITVSNPDGRGARYILTHA